MLKCVVCGDTSSTSRNYKTILCLGCKSFFRRAIVKKRKYFCEKDENCDVNERMGRQSCRACRFKKCLEVGLTEDVLRHTKEKTGTRRAKNRTQKEAIIISVDSQESSSEPKEKSNERQKESHISEEKSKKSQVSLMRKNMKRPLQFREVGLIDRMSISCNCFMCISNSMTASRLDEEGASNSMAVQTKSNSSFYNNNMINPKRNFREKAQELQANSKQYSTQIYSPISCSSLSMSSNSSTDQDSHFLKLIKKLIKDDSTIRAKKCEVFRLHAEAVKLGRSFLGDKCTIGHSCYFTEGLHEVQIYDMSMVTSKELYSMIEWAQTLEDFKQLPLNIRLALLKRFAIYHLLLENGYQTASKSDSNNVWLIGNGTCYPRTVESLPIETQKLITPERRWRQEKLWNKWTNRCIDDVAIPMKELKLRPEEFVVLKLIMFFQSYEIWNLPERDQEINRLITESRNKAIQALFAFYKSTNVENYEERFGNVILFTSGVVSAAAVLSEAYQIMRLFVCKFDSITKQLLFDES